MRRILGQRLSPDVLDSHWHICDLINIEYPVLQLFTDGKRNWIYLWCDRGIGGSINRWLVFPTSRALMVDYLEGRETMLALVRAARAKFLLDTAQPFTFPTRWGGSERRFKRTVTRVQLDGIAEYLPSEDSYFDPELTADLDLSKELMPTTYSVPIDGDWFGQDFTYMFKAYERLYAFFYSTQPRFVTTLSHNLSRLLRSPWTGGFSRLNLFSLLPRQVPGLHSLKVREIQYASPGHVQFEAISSVGDSVRIATNAFVEREATVMEASKKITKTLTAAGLNQTDLSIVKDENAPLNPAQRTALEEASASIGHTLGIETELATLRQHSPNIVVYSKAVVSFLRQLSKLAALQRDGMLAFSESQHLEQ